MTSLRVESLACATALAALSLSACLAPTVAPAAEIIAVATGVVATGTPHPALATLAAAPVAVRPAVRRPPELRPCRA